MSRDLTIDEKSSAGYIVSALTDHRVRDGIGKLQELKNSLYAAIPPKMRQSRGITWVLQRISDLITESCREYTVTESTNDLETFGLILHDNLPKNDILQGVPIFLLAEYGKQHPYRVYPFFEEVAGSEDWVVREFAAGGFHTVIAANRHRVVPWLKHTAQSSDPNLRRFVSETLRPVTSNRWINLEPDFSLDVLRLLFREAHPYPRTSVGNNLSDLSGHQPELIFSVAQGLVDSGDKNSYWIAHRACRNLVKKNPQRVMDILKIDEYHYKDRNFHRKAIV